MSSSPLKSVFLMLLASLFFASMSALVKKISPQVPLFEIILFRSLVAAIILSLLCQRLGISLAGKNKKLLILRGLSGFLALTAIFYSLAHISLGDQATIAQSTPLFVIFFSAFFLEERIQKKSLIPLFGAVLGISLILKPEGNFLNYGGLIALLGAILASLAYIFIRLLHRSDQAPVMSFYFASISALFSLPFCFLDWVNPSLETLIILIAIGLLGTLGQLAISFAYKYAPASFVSPFAYTGVPISFIYGYYFFNEIPNEWTLLGVILTLSSCLALSFFRSSIKSHH